MSSTNSCTEAIIRNGEHTDIQRLPCTLTEIKELSAAIFTGAKVSAIDNHHSRLTKVVDGFNNFFQPKQAGNRIVSARPNLLTHQRKGFVADKTAFIGTHLRQDFTQLKCLGMAEFKICEGFM